MNINGGKRRESVEPAIMSQSKLSEKEKEKIAAIVMLTVPDDIAKQENVFFTVERFLANNVNTVPPEQEKVLAWFERYGSNVPMDEVEFLSRDTTDMLHGKKTCFRAVLPADTPANRNMVHLINPSGHAILRIPDEIVHKYGGAEAFGKHVRSMWQRHYKHLGGAAANYLQFDAAHGDIVYDTKKIKEAGEECHGGVCKMKKNESSGVEQDLNASHLLMPNGISPNVEKLEEGYWWDAMLGEDGYIALSYMDAVDGHLTHGTMPVDGPEGFQVHRDYYITVRATPSHINKVYRASLANLMEKNPNLHVAHFLFDVVHWREFVVMNLARLIVQFLTILEISLPFTHTKSYKMKHASGHTDQVLMLNMDFIPEDEFEISITNMPHLHNIEVCVQSKIAKDSTVKPELIEFQKDLHNIGVSDRVLGIGSRYVFLPGQNQLIYRLRGKEARHVMLPAQGELPAYINASILNVMPEEKLGLNDKFTLLVRKSIN